MLNFPFIMDVIPHHLSLFYGSGWGSFKERMAWAFHAPVSSF